MARLHGLVPVAGGRDAWANLRQSDEASAMALADGAFAGWLWCSLQWVAWAGSLRRTHELCRTQSKPKVGQSVLWRQNSR